MDRAGGNWRTRIDELVRKQGHEHVWSYLRAHPGVGLVELADQIGGDVSAVQLQGLVVEHCLANRQMGELVRDLLVRGVHQELPRGWGAAKKSDRARALWLFMREPYRSVIDQIRQTLLEQAPPPESWSPASADDPLLVRVYEQALATLPPHFRQMLERGEESLDPGDAYSRAIEPHFEAVSIYDGPARFAEQLAAVPPPIGHLLAVHWCQSEVRNGGLLQFFQNPTGVLAPEAVAGFQAIGMPRSSAVLAEALEKLGEPYPRDRQRRALALAKVRRAEADPFHALDEQLYAHLSSEASGFANAADAYFYRAVDEDD